jgi:DNA-binding NtrC family response regulator
MSPSLYVMVVEWSVRSFASEVLRDDGWVVCEAESSEQAFSMVREHEWAAVFCDVSLGGADGFSVLRRFKEELPRTKVVLMTGHGSAVGALDATASGAYDYLLKPFGVEELRSLSAALRERIGRRPDRRLMDRRRVPATDQTSI